MRTRYRCNDPRDPHYEPEMRSEIVTVPCPVCADDRFVPCYYRGGEWHEIEVPTRCLNCDTDYSQAQREAMEDAAYTLMCEL